MNAQTALCVAIRGEEARTHFIASGVRRSRENSTQSHLITDCFVCINAKNFRFAETHRNEMLSQHIFKLKQHAVDRSTAM